MQSHVLQPCCLGEVVTGDPRVRKSSPPFIHCPGPHRLGCLEDALEPPSTTVQQPESSLTPLLWQPSCTDISSSLPCANLLQTLGCVGGVSHPHPIPIFLLF